LALINRDTFLKNASTEVAVCGRYYGGDTVHVGLAWIDKDTNQEIAFHFQHPTHIPFDSLKGEEYSQYSFNKLIDFDLSILPSMSALCELISQNKLDSVIFNRNGVVYDGGKFTSTGDYSTKHISERIMNCAVFTIALLNTYDYQLIKWDSWPSGHDAGPYLDPWFSAHEISGEIREHYYKTSKLIRGFHVLAAPSAKSRPATFEEVSPIANELLTAFKAG